MISLSDENTWAWQEFSQADLGDEWRTARLVRMAAQVAHTPAGQITAVFRQAAQREAAFRFLENDGFSAQQLAAAAHQACAQRASAFPYVFIPTDGSSLLLSDTEGTKGFDGVGWWAKGGSGLQTLTAIALSPEGIPLRILGQQMWAREQRTASQGTDCRAPHQRESQRWLDLMHDVQQVLI
jgi:hypothetical protein